MHEDGNYSEIVFHLPIIWTRLIIEWHGKGSEVLSKSDFVNADTKRCFQIFNFSQIYSWAPEFPVKSNRWYQDSCIHHQSRNYNRKNWKIPVF